MRSTALLISVGLLSLAAGALQACATTSDNGAAATQDVHAASAVNVLSSRNDLNRTGHNDQERTLNVANVNSQSFGRIFSRPLDGQVYAQPLVANVGGKSLVIVATEHNTIYAFDANDTSESAPPVWSKNLGFALPAQMTGCGLLTPEIGITATPVIDLATNTIWFTSRHLENQKAVHKLNALDIATGEHKANSPMVITAKANGNGSTSVNGVITFDPLKQMQRPGLLKVGNEIVIGFGSQCDSGPYHGWLLGYDATTLQQNRVHITTPNGGEGSIWNGGVGINADENGDIYFPAADAYDRSHTPWNGAGNEADSLVRLHDDGTKWNVVTMFTAFDAPTYSPQDLSFGNGGGILLPGTNLYLSGDKRGQVFTVDRDNMGGISPNDQNAVQKWQASKNYGTPGGGSFLKGANNTGIYYTWGTGDQLKAWKFDGQKFASQPLVNLQSQTGYPGVTLSLSSDGQKDGTAILWGVKGKRTSAGLAASTGAGVLVAFDALDVTKQLYSSDTIASDQLGNATKFAPPTVANGKVFVGTSSNQLVVYGLRNGSAPPQQAQTDAGPGPVDPPATDAGPPVGAAPTWTDVYATLIGPGTPGHCSGTGGCHTQIKGGFKCGTTADDCYAGLVAKGLITPDNAAASPIISDTDSPLAWFGGAMPLDNPEENPDAAAKLKAWVLAGAQKN